VALTRRASRDAALVELQRLHAAIQASRARRGVGLDVGPATETPSREAVATRDLTRRLQAGAHAPAHHVAEPAPRSRRGWWLAIGAVVIVAGAWAALTLPQRREAATEAAGAAPAAGPGTAPATVPPADAALAAAPAAPAKAIRLTLETIRPVWLRVTVDGARAFEGELPAGEKLASEGDRVVVVRAGDAGGVRATMNGVERGPLGRDGWPLTVSITPGGIEPLTPTRPEP
jgi:Domain of unknown function (DUF4115)